MYFFPKVTYILLIFFDFDNQYNKHLGTVVLFLMVRTERNFLYYFFLEILISFFQFYWDIMDIGHCII